MIMAKLTDFMDAPAQLSIDELLAEIEAEEQPQNGLCPQRARCLIERLGVKPESVASGYRCGFEATHCLWQCHVSGVKRESER